MVRVQWSILAMAPVIIRSKLSFSKLDVKSADGTAVSRSFVRRS